MVFFKIITFVCACLIFNLEKIWAADINPPENSPSMVKGYGATVPSSANFSVPYNSGPAPFSPFREFDSMQAQLPLPPLVLSIQKYEGGEKQANAAAEHKSMMLLVPPTDWPYSMTSPVRGGPVGHGENEKANSDKSVTEKQVTLTLLPEGDLKGLKGSDAKPSAAEKKEKIKKMAQSAAKWRKKNSYMLRTAGFTALVGLGLYGWCLYRMAEYSFDVKNHDPNLVTGVLFGAGLAAFVLSLSQFLANQCAY